MIERWELIQAQSLGEKHRHKQDLQQWQQLMSDLQNMRAWLGHAEAELGQLRELVHSAEINTIQQRIKKLKVCLRLPHQALDAFDLEPISMNRLIYDAHNLCSFFFPTCPTFTNH